LMELNATFARCPECGQEILISNPREGKVVVCGSCHSELELHRKAGGSSSPILGYVASFFAGAFFGPFITAWLWAEVLKRAKAI